MTPHEEYHFDQRLNALETKMGMVQQRLTAVDQKVLTEKVKADSWAETVSTAMADIRDTLEAITKR
jgi:hypothetical protein